MRFFTQLRTALELAARVEQLEDRVQNLQFEWTDILDKLLAREERMRKRYRTEVNNALAQSAPAAEAGGNDKGALRARFAALRAAGK